PVGPLARRDAFRDLERRAMQGQAADRAVGGADGRAEPARPGVIQIAPHAPPLGGVVTVAGANHRRRCGGRVPVVLNHGLPRWLWFRSFASSASAFLMAGRRFRSLGSTIETSSLSDFS